MLYLLNKDRSLGRAYRRHSGLILGLARCSESFTHSRVLISEEGAGEGGGGGGVVFIYLPSISSPLLLNLSSAGLEEEQLSATPQLNKD